MVLLLVCCSAPVEVTGGNSSETVIGRVVNRDGSPATSIVVTLYPADYNPVADVALQLTTHDTTDAQGNYRILAPDSLTDYSIVAIDQKKGTRALVSGTVVENDTTSAPEAVLAPPGVISVAVPDSVAGGYVYIPGTGIVAAVGSGAMVIIRQVPAGVIPSINFVALTSPATSNVIVSNIAIFSNDTVVIPYPEWRYSTKVFLNTTASGAGVMGTVADFPVLVRLTKETFDFSQALAGGVDLRFTGADGAQLSHEIERWDSVTSRSEVWVRVPKVLGNNNSQYIVMHWGARSAPAFSDGNSVFDTSTGFQAVWHLATNEGTVFDATVNGYNGITYGMTAASMVSGVVGDACQFNGSTSYITIPNSAAGHLDMPQNGAYSLSCWVYADSIDSLWHAIAGKGHEQYYLKLKCFKNGTATWEFVEFQDNLGWQYTEDSIPPSPGAKEWVYLTGVRSGEKQYLYINGALVNDSVPLMTGEYPRNLNDDFTIGKHAREVAIPNKEGWCYFGGKIDEVRVMNVVPSADWVRLCYMNQKAEDALVEVR